VCRLRGSVEPGFPHQRPAGSRPHGVNLWIADWSLSEAEAVRLLSTSGAYPVVAVQWASPASNPNTTVPGGAKTLAEANLDLSITIASWFPKP